MNAQETILYCRPLLQRERERAVEFAMSGWVGDANYHRKQAAWLLWKIRQCEAELSKPASVCAWCAKEAGQQVLLTGLQTHTICEKHMRGVFAAIGCSNTAIEEMVARARQRKAELEGGPA